jgi:hypothetical protein
MNESAHEYEEYERQTEIKVAKATELLKIYCILEERTVPNRHCGRNESGATQGMGED